MVDPFIKGETANESERKIKDLWCKEDRDGDGKLNYEEFKKFLKAYTEKLLRSESFMEPMDAGDALNEFYDPFTHEPRV